MVDMLMFWFIQVLLKVKKVLSPCNHGTFKRHGNLTLKEKEASSIGRPINATSLSTTHDPRTRHNTAIRKEQ